MNTLFVVNFGCSLLLAIALCLPLTRGLDEESAKERRCTEIPDAKELDYKWMASIKTWYFPIWSKLELYRGASDLLAEPMSNIPNSVVDSPCVFSDSKFMSYGFGRTEIEADFSFAEDGTIDFKVRGSDYAKSGKHKIAYTNNKDFIVGVTCWEDDEESYAAWTTEPQVTEQNKKLIWNFLEEKGFNLEYFIETPYDNCKEILQKYEKQEL